MAEYKETENNQEGLGRILFSMIKEWCLVSSCHGIPNIVRSTSKTLIGVWSFFTVIFTLTAVIFIFVTFQDYGSHPTSSSIEIVDQVPAKFPSILMCLLSPYKTEDERVAAYLKNLTDPIPRNISPLEYLEYTQTVIRRQMILMPRSEAQKLTYELKDMLLDCKMGGSPCNSSDFVYSFSNNYGNCYLYNPNDRINVGRVGPEYGLSVEIYLGNSSTASYSASRGLRIVIFNNSRDLPFVRDEGMNIAPGFVSNIGLIKGTQNRLGPPYGECLGDDVASEAKNRDNPILKLMVRSNVTKYSQFICQNMCFEFVLLKTCNCMADSSSVKSDEQFCHNSSQVECQKKMYYTFSRDPSQYCQLYCPIECNSDYYTIDPNLSEYMTEWLWDYQKSYYTSYTTFSNDSNELARKELYKKLSKLSYSQVKSNLLKLNIYFKMLAYKWVYETPIWSNQSLLSSIGGQLGLWIGASLMTFIEVLEAFILLARRLVSWIIAKCNSANRVVTSE